MASSGRAYTLELRRPRVDILQIEDVCFGLDREVLLPVGPQAFGDEPESDPGQGLLSGLDAIRAALEFASFHREKQLLVAGHTDASGSDAHNLALSGRRAESVLLYLRGEREAWAAHAADNDEIADLQTILKWAARTMGWPCDPGPVDGEWGNQTKSGRRAFRQIANANFGLSLDLDAKTNQDDWGAIFDTYDLALTTALKLDADGLRALRAELRFVGEGTLGCGEHWPVSGLHLDDQVVAQDRRVEFLWFDADEVVDTGGGLPGEAIYGSGRFVFEPVPAHPGHPLQTLHFEVRCQLLDHFHVEPVAQRPYRLRGPLPDVAYDRTGLTDADGRLHQDELPAGDYLLEIDGAAVVVGTHYTFFTADPDDVVRVAVEPAESLPDSPRPYADPWLLIDDEEDDGAFADVGVDPYEPDEPHLDEGLLLLEDDDDASLSEEDSHPDATAA